MFSLSSYIKIVTVHERSQEGNITLQYKFLLINSYGQ